VPKRIGDFISSGRLGLLGMHERARLLEGTFEIQSGLGQGTKIVAELPQVTRDLQSELPPCYGTPHRP
jgi:nitrate/nitrite-specific signal transduction histidine kinase